MDVSSYEDHDILDFFCLGGKKIQKITWDLSADQFHIYEKRKENWEHYLKIYVLLNHIMTLALYKTNP